nr:probable acyl-activating enzyme 6 [Tanacetum cinerariifolium]
MDALSKPNSANSCPLTPLGFLERAATIYSDSISLVDNNLTYSWSDTFSRCLRLASSISRLGIVKGDVVSVIAPNIPAIYELHYAAPMAGAVINTINTRLDARTISILLRHSESKLLFVYYNLIHLIQEAVYLLPGGCARPRLVLIIDDGPQSIPTNHFINTYENMVETETDEHTTNPPTQQAPRTLSTIKLPILKKDETAFPSRDARYGEAFPTVTSLDAGQDRENIAKTYDVPHKASPRVTSLGGDDGREDLLVGDTVKDSDKSVDKESESIDDMANVLGTLGATNILANGGLRSVFTTTSLSVATASTIISHVVATASGNFPTARIFTTVSVATPTTRVTRSSRGVVIESSSLISVNIPSISNKDKEKGKMTEPEQPSKEKVLEQMSAQLARDLEAKSNKIVAKYLSKYKQAEAGLSHDEKVELIDELLMYQRNLAKINKYQAQQSKPAPKTKRRDFYMLILGRNAGKDARFVLMNSKLESERLKRPGIHLGKESFKKLNTAKASGTEPTQEQQSKEPKELSEEELKEMIEIRKYWKIIRVGNHTEVYQIFDDMLKKFNKKDLDRLWSLVKETYNITEVTDEKQKELWVEPKILYEPDSRDQL